MVRGSCDIVRGYCDALTSSSVQSPGLANVSSRSAPHSSLILTSPREKKVRGRRGEGGEERRGEERGGGRRREEKGEGEGKRKSREEKEGVLDSILHFVHVLYSFPVDRFIGVALGEYTN